MSPSNYIKNIKQTGSDSETSSSHENQHPSHNKFSKRGSRRGTRNRVYNSRNSYNNNDCEPNEKTFFNPNQRGGSRNPRIYNSNNRGNFIRGRGGGYPDNVSYLINNNNNNDFNNNSDYNKNSYFENETAGPYSINHYDNSANKSGRGSFSGGRGQNYPNNYRGNNQISYVVIEEKKEEKEESKETYKYKTTPLQNKEKKFLENYKIPESFNLCEIKSDSLFNPRNKQNEPDFYVNFDNEESNDQTSDIISNNSNFENDFDDMKNLIFEDDEQLLIKKTPILIALERKHGFMKQVLTGIFKDVKIVRKDNIYYFQGENSKNIYYAKKNLINFMERVKFPKFFKMKTADPKLAMRSILHSQYFKEVFYPIQNKYKAQNIYIQFITSFHYYNQMKLMSQRSKLFTEKLNKKPENNAFIRILLSSKKNYDLISTAEKELRSALESVNYSNEIFYFSIDLPPEKKLESTAEITKNISLKAHQENIGLRLLFTKTNEKKFLIDGFMGALYKPKKFVKTLDLANYLPVKGLCFLLDELTTNNIKLNDYGNVLIYKYFIQEEFERKVRAKGIDVKLDKQNFLLIFNKPCQYKEEINSSLADYAVDRFDIFCEIKVFDKPLNISELYLDEIYEKFFNFFRNGDQIGQLIKQRIDLLNNSEKFIRICYKKKELIRKQSMNFIFFFKMIYLKTIEFSQKKSMIMNEMKNFIEKFCLIIVKTPEKFDPKKITDDFSCFFIEMTKPEKFLFIIGNKKNIQSVREYLDSQNLSQMQKKYFQISDMFKNLEIFKKLKHNLKSKNILLKEDQLQISKNLLGFISFKEKFQDRCQKLESYLEEFQKDCFFTNKFQLLPHELEYLNMNPKILRDLENQFGVQMKLNDENARKLHFTLEHNDKNLNLFNNEIQYIKVDAIINSHSNALLNSEFQGEGINKIILIQAGLKYKLELADYIKFHKNLKETEVFTSSSGSMKTCKNIINVSTPMYNPSDPSASYKQKLELTFGNIIREAEKKEFSSIAIPFIGTGIFGLPFEEVFKALLKSAQENFFTSMQIKFLKEINICEVDLNKINEAKKLLKTFSAENSANKKESKFIWKWKDDDKIFKNYDDYINDKIDEAYEVSLKNGSCKVDIYFNIFKQPGTHKFDLIEMTVTDIAKHHAELLENKFDCWYHNNIMYSNQVSEIITMNQKNKNFSFELFLKSYIIDFEKMNQINRETNFKRELQKIEKVGEISSIKTEFNLLDYNKKIIYDNEWIKGENENFLIFTNFLDKSKNLEAHSELENIFKKKLERYSCIVYDLSQNKINALKLICLQEKVYVEGELKEKIKCDITITGAKSSLKVFKEELAKPDLPWDNTFGKSQFVNLSENEEEYKAVFNNFRKTMPNSIISIKRVQNDELYICYQNNLKRAKERKNREGMILTGKEDFEMWLWHGTSRTDPQELVETTSTGLSTQFANDSCLWGRGIYFAVNASYSDGYAFSKLTRKYLLLCKVFVGEYTKLPSDKSLRQPPYKNSSKKIMYDSVQGETGGSIIFITYENYWNYPFYLVEYQL